MPSLFPARPGRQRPAVLLAVAAVAAAAAARLLVPAPARGTPVAVVLLTETSNAPFGPAPAEPLPAPVSSWSRDPRPRFRLGSPVDVRGRLPLLLLHRLEVLDRVLAERVVVRPGGRLGYDAGRPFAVPGWAWREDGPVPVADLVDDSRRLVSGRLELERDGAGHVRLRHGAAAAELAPGERWGEGWVQPRAGAPVEVVADTPDWERRMAAALASGARVTVLTVTNLGLWPAEAFTAPGEGP